MIPQITPTLALTACIVGALGVGYNAHKLRQIDAMLPVKRRMRALQSMLTGYRERMAEAAKLGAQQSQEIAALHEALKTAQAETFEERKSHDATAQRMAMAQAALANKCAELAEETRWQTDVIEWPLTTPPPTTAATRPSTPAAAGQTAR